jgi:hypothetical protein
MTKTISAAEADALVGGRWFTGYTKTVALVEQPITVKSFDAEARAEAAGNPEYIIFNAGLTVTGLLDLSSDVHSIFVVRNTLHAKQIILGDAVLAVLGRIVATDFVFGGRTEGVLEIAGAQIERDRDAIADAITAPAVALFDRNTRGWLLRDHSSTLTENELVAETSDDDGVQAGLIKKRLLAGKKIFR